jgi:hypothetical protein
MTFHYSKVYILNLDITSDLFPGIEMPKKDESMLSQALIKACEINEWIPK